jgi:DUF2950 family protein
MQRLAVNAVRVGSWLRLLVAMSVPLFMAYAGASFAAGPLQTTFATPEQGFEALAEALRTGSVRELIKILGPEGETLVQSGDPVEDKHIREQFMELYYEADKIVLDGSDRAILEIGKNEWPLPIPMVKEGSAWRFDTAAGKEEILDRRIGRNELSAIQVCHAYVDAQREYASKDRNGDGFDEYAQKFASTPGKHDGLYWPAAESEEESPLGPLVASAQAVGYKVRSPQQETSAPYYGYYYRILDGQGNHAAGGAYDYIVKGHMIGGFALIAFPAQYDVSGIMTFIVNQDGIVYQKDLGPKTAELAAAITRYDPDATWKPAE